MLIFTPISSSPDCYIFITKASFSMQRKSSFVLRSLNIRPTFSDTDEEVTIRCQTEDHHFLNSSPAIVNN